MRQFTDDEKCLIRLFVTQAEGSATFVLTNILNDWFNGTNLAFDGKNLHFDMNIGAEQLLEYEKCIIFRALLIKYLIDNAYIYIVKDGTTVNPSKTIGNLENENLTAKKQMPKDVANILANVNNRVFVTENLKILVKNDFKTFEELSLEESKKQTRKATWGLVLSFIAIIIAIITLLAPYAINTKKSVENNDSACDQCELMTQIMKVMDSTAEKVTSIEKIMADVNSKLEPKIVTKYKTRYKTKYITQPATYKVACGDSLELVQVNKQK